MGRVIVVWTRDEDAAMAKREGDRVEVEVHTEAANGEYFDKARKWVFSPGRPKGKGNCGVTDVCSFPPPRITLRLLALPPTPLQPPDPSKTHLSAPAATKNYLVSPPGSPPEGWEPVVEEPPNSVSLAEDLRKALEALVVQRRRLGGVADDEDDEIENRAEVILQTEDGFIVQVEDTARHESTEEPSAKGIHLVKATADGMRNGAHDEQLDEEGGGEAGWRTPGLGETTYRILPTARPPV
jgi:hypothetical protein